MLVEIKGIDWRNLGAELMLVAILEAFQQQGITANFTVEPPTRKWFLKHYGLRLKLRYMRRGINLLKPLQWIPGPLRRKLDWVLPSDVDVVIDASGFGYGDTWGHRAIEHRLGGTVKELTENGVPVILLPQALGPFKKKLQREAFLPILRHANLIFARDEQSLAHLRSLLPDESSRSSCAELKLAPDFTNLVKASPEQLGADVESSLCLIVNNKMRTKRGDGEKYLNFLIELMQWCWRCQHPFYVLLHEREEDKALVEELKQRCDFTIKVVEPTTAKQAKAYIKKSRLVVTSRFHGLVSAITQGVPVVATSWGHKYDALLDEYGIGRHKIILDGPAALWQDLLFELSSATGQAAARQHLVEQQAEAIQATQAMWTAVFHEINKKHQALGKEKT